MKDDPELPICNGFKAPLSGVTQKVCAHRLSEHCGFLLSRFQAITMRTQSSLSRSAHLSFPTFSRRSSRHQEYGPAIQTP